MKNFFDILQSCPLFDGIKEEQLSAVLECMDVKIKSCSPKQTIIAEGEEARCIGIVLSGAVQLERTDYYGNRSIIARIVPPGLFGEACACAGTEHMPISAVAAENTEIILIDCKKIISACSNACAFHSRMIFNLLKIVATKNIMLNQKAEITSRRTTREKLMAYLLSEAKRNQTNTFKVPFDRQALADYLSVDRSGLSAEISKLRAEGILESKGSLFSLKVKPDFF